MIRFFLGAFEAAFITGAPYLTTALYPRAVGQLSSIEMHAGQLTL